MDHAISETTIDGFPVTVLAAPGVGLEATFAPQVGMCGCSLRHRGEELLGQRRGLAGYAATGSSFGIPLLHPWANRLAGLSYRVDGEWVELDPARHPIRLDEHGLPIHGLLAASPDWRIVDASADDASARLAAELDFGADPELLSAFPFRHRLRLDVRLSGARLSIRAGIHATGERAVPVAFGFHPYLTLPGVPRERWAIELPVRRRAVLDERGIPTGETEAPAFTGGMLGDRAFDDLFPELAEPATFALSGAGRRIEVELVVGYTVAQVYAPPGSDFICFEPMTAPTNALASGDGLRRVAPDTSFAAEFAIEIADVS